MTILYEGRHRGEFLISEAAHTRSRDVGTLLSGQNLSAGTVLGQITNSSATSVAGANTGNGIMGAVTVGAQALPGDYVVKINKAAANAGDFSVTDPQGDVVGVGSVAAAYNNGGLAFTLADGSTDFAVGDSFTITVTGNGKRRSLNLGAADGSQRAGAILFDNVDASAGEKIVVLITRDAEVNGSDLVWPVGITNPQKAAAIAQLAVLGIIVR